ncbi:hypothetical protein L7F22_051301 [Adiantum nelumboides]|nr:hypothetical protein [Adiantum nelumboides]
MATRMRQQGQVQKGRSVANQSSMQGAWKVCAQVGNTRTRCPFSSCSRHMLQSVTDDEFDSATSWPILSLHLVANSFSPSKMEEGMAASIPSVVGGLRTYTAPSEVSFEKPSLDPATLRFHLLICITLQTALMAALVSKTNAAIVIISLLGLITFVYTNFIRSTSV